MLAAGSRDVAERRRGRSREGPEFVDEVRGEPLRRFSQDLTRRRGSRHGGSFVRERTLGFEVLASHARPAGRAACFRDEGHPSGWLDVGRMGWRSRDHGEKALEGRKTRRVAASSFGWGERTHRGSKASKRVKSEVGANPGARRSGGPESGSRSRGKGAHSQRGNQAAAPTGAGVGETGGERCRASRPALWWMTARKQRASRGVTVLAVRGRL